MIQLLGDGEVKCHTWATTNPALKRAKFRPVYVEKKTGLSILHKPRAHEKCTPWTGVVEGDEVLLRDVQITSAGRIAAVSRKQLEKLGVQPAVIQ